MHFHGQKGIVISQNSPGHHWTVHTVRKFCTELNPDLLLPSAALGYAPLYAATSFLFMKRALPPGSAGVLFPRRSTPSSFKGSLYITWLCCPALPLLLHRCISLLVHTKLASTKTTRGTQAANTLSFIPLDCESSLTEDKVFHVSLLNCHPLSKIFSNMNVTM